MNNYHKGSDQGLVLIHPDHHRCYFYEGYFDHKKIVKFLSEKEKAFLRPFDHLSIEMHKYYNLPIVILLLNKDDNDSKNIFTGIADLFHNDFFFTYVDEEIAEGKYPVFKLKSSDQKFNIKEKVIVSKLIAELGFQWKNSPQIYVYFQSKNNFAQKWLFHQELSRTNLTKFLNNIKQKKEKPHQKSQELNELRVKGNVR